MHNVVATFDGAAAARAALVLLERRGIEADDIELFGPGMTRIEAPLINDDQRAVDVDVLKAMERRWIAGVAVGAVVGAIIGAVIAAAASGGPTPVVGAAVAGALLVGALGFLWAGFSGMSANEQWGETFEGDGGETSVVVHSDDPHEVETALAALRAAHARHLATCGADGNLHDVA
jgi:outer membrane lipoprotein SlyB